MYSDQALSIGERATRLLADTLAAIHEELFTFFVSRSEEYDLSQTGPLLDHLFEDLTNVRVVGEIESERSGSSATQFETGSSYAVAISPQDSPTLEIRAESHDRQSRSDQTHQ
jgi:hypothetical protein